MIGLAAATATAAAAAADDDATRGTRKSGSSIPLWHQYDDVNAGSVGAS